MKGVYFFEDEERDLRPYDNNYSIILIHHSDLKYYGITSINTITNNMLRNSQYAYLSLRSNNY